MEEVYHLLESMQNADHNSFFNELLSSVSRERKQDAERSYFPNNISKPLFSS